MDRCVGAAPTMPGDDRKDLAIQALARSATVSDLSTRHGVSRKFVYLQANKARHVLDDAFLSAATDDTVLFQVQVTKRWLRQVIVALADDVKDIAMARRVAPGDLLPRAQAMPGIGDRIIGVQSLLGGVEQMHAPQVSASRCSSAAKR